jgi:hypothetical protein
MADLKCTQSKKAITVYLSGCVCNSKVAYTLLQQALFRFDFSGKASFL